MPDVVRRLVERRAARLVVVATAGDQEMPHAPALRDGFPRWRADAGLPADRLWWPGARELAEGALLGPVLQLPFRLEAKYRLGLPGPQQASNSVLVVHLASDTSVKHPYSMFVTLLICPGDPARTIFACWRT
jgi:hypothetical protein